MTRPSQLFRLLRIAQVLLKHGLDDFVTAIHLFRPYRYISYAMPWRWRRSLKKARGERLREALEDLGPVFIKFGQMLSTRPDLLPEDIAFELSKLQDQVPPFPGDVAKSLIEKAYGKPLADNFAAFESSPMASASVAQVHAAKLPDGSDVVVKVLRPNIQQVIDRDLALLYALARLAERYWREGPRLHPVEMVDEYDKTIHDELDLRVEAANANQLRANFENSEIIYVPKVYWEYARKDVMVMERIYGIPIRDMDALQAAGIDMRKLAHNGVEIFFTQAFRDGFFHADMHPGNIFVSKSGQYRAVDFGIMGTLGEDDKRYLAENLLGFFNRDYRAVAEAHLNAGWVPAHVRVNEFEAAIRTVCEPIFAKPISEISFGKLIVQLFQTARRFEMPIQPQLVLLQKTLLNIEGLGRQLYPELDLWETAKPFLETWMRRQFGPRAFHEGLKRELPKWGRMLPEMPALAHGLLRKLHDDETAAQRQVEELKRLRQVLSRGQHRLFIGMVGAVLLLAAAMISALDGYAPLMLNHAPISSWILGGLGVLFLLISWPSGE